MTISKLFPRAIGTITLLTVFLSSYAQIETDRPDFTNSPNLVPEGALQIETGFVLENDEFSGSLYSSCSVRNVTFNTTLLRFGLTKNIELRANYSYNQKTILACEYTSPLFDPHPSFFEPNKGFQTSFIGFKTNLYKSDKVSIGFLGHL